MLQNLKNAKYAIRMHFSRFDSCVHLNVFANRYLHLNVEYSSFLSVDRVNIHLEFGIVGDKLMSINCVFLL